MKKFLTIILIALGCFFGFKTFATNLFTEFDGFNDGQLIGQGDWLSYFQGEWWEISNEHYMGTSGKSALKKNATNSCDYEILSVQATSSMEFSVQMGDMGGSDEWGYVEFWDNDIPSSANRIRFDWDASSNTVEFTYGDSIGKDGIFATGTKDTWYTVRFEYGILGCYFIIDGQTGSGWIPCPQTINEYVDEIIICGYTSLGKIFLDSLEDECSNYTSENSCTAAGCLWLETYGCVKDWTYKGPFDLETPNFEYEMSENISILPSYPIDCQTTPGIYSGNATGKVSINANTASSSITCTELYMQGLESISDWSQQVLASTIINVSSGQTINYSLPYSFPATDTYGNDESWEISYATKCHYINYPNIKIMGFHQCNDTFIGAEPTDLLELRECEIQYDLEQCTSSAWSMEKYTCELGNMVKGIFVPSCKNRIELRKNMDLMKGHAPYNYVIGFSGFMSSFIDPTTTATAESTGTFAGIYAIQQITIKLSEISFFDTIRNMFTGLLMIMVGLYLFKRLKNLF